MKRRALLIDAGRADLTEIIDGCSVDVKQMKQWLTSFAGGAWNEDEEIVCLHNRPLATIQQGVKWVEAADFAFVAFSGHGHVNDVGGKRHQAVIVGDCQEINFNTLKPKTGRSIVICDACRRVRFRSPIRMSFAENVRRYVKASSAKYTREDYKREYIRLLGQADGRYLMYSCSTGQVSGEDAGLAHYLALISCSTLSM